MEVILHFLNRVGFGKVLFVGAIILGVSLLMVGAAIKFTEPEYMPLYSNLDVEDSNKIVAALEAKNVPYKLSSSGSKILVPEDMALRARMNLAKDGLPSKGNIIGYEIFDRLDGFSTPNFIQNVHLVRALEGEIARTIGTFDQVRKARVHLVLPKRELFSKELQEPSASVVLDLRTSNRLSKEEVSAISNLVAAAVPNLDIKKIAIVDTHGRPLKLIESEDSDEAMSNNLQDYKFEYENKLRNTLIELLEKSVGTGGVEVRVSADINFDKTITNSEIYDPSGQVVRSVQTIQESEHAKEAQNQDLSVQNNVPTTPTAGQAASGNENNTQKTDETTNYEISKTVKNHISAAGTIKKLSIAVLVDGSYIKDPISGNSKVYTPRPQAELDSYAALVKSAVGFDVDRGDKVEVINLQFTKEPELTIEETFMDWLKIELSNNLHSIFRTVVIGTVLIVMLLTFVKPFVNNLLNTAMAAIKNQVEAEVAIAQAEVKATNMKMELERERQRIEMKKQIGQTKMNLQTSKGLAGNINDMVQECPDESIAVLKKWINNNNA